MFSLREFIKQGFLDAVGYMADYQIILNAGGWYNQGVLLQEDLAEIQAKINEKNNPVEEPSQDDGSFNISAENSENTAESAENTNEEVTE